MRQMTNLSCLSDQLFGEHDCIDRFWCCANAFNTICFWKILCFYQNFMSTQSVVFMHF